MKVLTTIVFCHKIDDMKKNLYDKSLSRTLAASIIFTIALPLGIVLTVVGAVNLDQSALFKAFLGIGIACVAVGFYGTPLAWIKYGETKKYGRIMYAITSEGLQNADDIGRHLDLKTKEVCDAVVLCIKKKYLQGYTLNGTEILPVYAKKKDRTFALHCPYCGGITESDDPHQTTCSFCGRNVENKN